MFLWERRGFDGHPMHCHRFSNENLKAMQKALSILFTKWKEGVAIETPFPFFTKMDAN